MKHVLVSVLSVAVLLLLGCSKPEEASDAAPAHLSDEAHVAATPVFDDSFEEGATSEWSEESTSEGQQEQGQEQQQQ